MEFIGNIDVEAMSTEERQTLVVYLAKKFNVLEVILTFE